jgi:hypothetical protein
MKMNEVYIPKNHEAKEIYRNFISTYYYLLFNKSEPDYYKKILKFFYKEKAKSYYNFFNNNFYIKHNILFFTLYNQLPIEFLPLPDVKFYLKYPLITFYNKIKLNNKFISKNLKYIDTYWPSENNTILKDKYNLKKEENENKLDNYQFIFMMNTIFDLPKEFFEDKTLLLFTNNPIICSEYKINYNAKNILLVDYYIKLNSERYVKSDIKNKIVKISDIKYISIYENINKNDMEEVFKFKILKKDTYLYSSLNLSGFEYYKTLPTGIPTPYFFTLNPFNRVFDPLYLNNNNYVTSEYIITNDIKTLDLSTNIYFDNEILNDQYFENNTFIKCIDMINIKNNYKYCDYDFIDPNKKVKESNYNKRDTLFLLIWKNIGISDLTISYKLFLKKSLDIYSFFNLMSLVKTNNNENKLLSEELYLNSELHKNIIKTIEYTNDFSKFSIYNQKEKYEQIYFSP